jgi:FKBP-type peptidyl-prolyl cis-trans isomerase (trigger factor)
MTREEIEQKMDELARKYVETHDKEIIEELYKLARELEKTEKEWGLTLQLRGWQGLLRRS